MTRPVLVTPRSLTAAGLDTVAELGPLRAAGFALVPGPAGRVPTERELLELVPGCVGWLAGIEPIGTRVLAAATDLRVISRNGSGTDAIDTAAAARAGIRVVRAEGANAQGVAELAIALALAGLRHVPWSAAALRAGGWDRHRGRELDECRVGVVGLGAIGGRVAGLFRALGADVVATDPVLDADTAPVPLVDLDALLAGCDVVTLHTPPGGRPLLDADRLSRVRRGTVLVNTARAALVDDAAVLAALEDGRLAAYAVDAFDSEPPALTPLLRHERVVATPHVGGFTGASVRRATAQAVENLLAMLTEVRT
ncbi:NAD(P)-dependent oxidoreductase [Pseudonocardia adelaidensis]|uniref:Phosphoglycerate dehydrogenase n=1 Tax=Pseudonocardia adelaidensis TaxID=648754 RepID=A0ABP9NVT5_9PSEU